MKIWKKCVAFAFLAGLTGLSFLAASPDIKLRLLEGVREGTAAGPTAVTSSYEKLDLMGTLPPDYSLDLEIAKIKKIFNLKDVKLITEANLKWPPRGDKIFHIIRFEGRVFLLLVTPAASGSASKFRVEVFEQKDKDKSQTNLLDTEFQLPANETVYLGFEDAKNDAYFLYLTWPTAGVEGGIEGGIEGGVVGEVEGGVKGGIEGGIAGGVEGGVEGGVIGGVEGGIVGVEDVAAPKLIKMVNPVYPEIARTAQVEGSVLLSATADAQGRVVAVKVLRSVPLLDQAAVDAVKQWIYEPMKVKGQAKPVVFTVTVAFKLDDKKKKTTGAGPDQTEKGAAEDVIRATGDIKPPKLLKVVNPVYPEIARQSQVEGVVIIEATTDPSGRVANAKVLRSIPLLDQAAVDAVKQWVYEPIKVKGKPIGIVFTVTVAFRLKDKADKGKVVSLSVDDEEFAKGAVKVEGEIKPPKLVKEAAPVYPLKAKQGRVEGIVILAVRIETSGRVKAVKVLRSIPVLDQAAVDAVKQWEYEPIVIKGKPVEAVFTVTVRFVMKKTGDKDTAQD